MTTGVVFDLGRVLFDFRGAELIEADFRAYVFENPYRLYTESKADFFAGTNIAARLPKVAKAATAKAGRSA